MDVTEVSLVHHIALVLALLCLLSSFGWRHPVLFFLSLLYLYKVHKHYLSKLRRRLQSEEGKYANQRRLLSDSESVRWLNHAVEMIWPICMERIASQQFLLPIMPWFLDKYKPWPARKAVVQHLYLGRNPPMFTEIRVLGESADDDHLVLELGMNFLSADDMSAILAVQLSERLGFGIWTNMHVRGMHVEGKVLVGVKFLRDWPFIGRMRVCFAELPYFQMMVKPLFDHGIDVTALPGIAGWLDKMLAVAFEQTLVEPNMLVLDVEKFVSAKKEGWFTVDKKLPIAYAKLEIIEAADLKPSDLNGLADPYVRGHLGRYKFRTDIQKKTLTPRWLEEFKVPIRSWESPNLLVLQVRDKDHIFDDILGDCSINITDLKDGQRHDMWLPLRNIKIGRLHLAITLLEGKEDEEVLIGEQQIKLPETDAPISVAEKCDDDGNFNGEEMVGEYEPIDITGQEKTGLWVHRPGRDVAQTWEPRKGRARHPETQVHRESNQSSDTSWSDHSDKDSSAEEGNHGHRIRKLGRGLRKISSLLNKSTKERSRKHEKENMRSRHSNIRAVGDKRIAFKLIVNDGSTGKDRYRKIGEESSSSEKEEVESPHKHHLRDKAKNFMKHAGMSKQKMKGALSKKVPTKRKEGEASEMAGGDGSHSSSFSEVGGYPVEEDSISDKGASHSSHEPIRDERE